MSRKRLITRNLFERYSFEWKKKRFLKSTLIGLFLLIASLIANFFAGTYASAHASSSVTDLILSNLPVVNVDEIFVEGSFLFLLVVTALIFWEPKRIPFVLKSTALFIFVRSFFIILTHVAPFPTVSTIDVGVIFSKFNFTGDLFFSGHTGLPFLMMLIFWNSKIWRAIFLCITLIFSATVLLGHIHYSVDVFGALFITYTIFHIALKFFPGDYIEFASEVV